VNSLNNLSGFLVLVKNESSKSKRLGGRERDEHGRVVLLESLLESLGVRRLPGFGGSR
jgi:hypothetical protein